MASVTVLFVASVLLVAVSAHPQLPEFILAMGSNASSPGPTEPARPPCVLINNYCGKVVPGTGMRKECCGDLVCYRNKCRRRTCC